MFDAIAILAQPEAWAALATLIVHGGRARHRQSDLHLDPVEQAAARRTAQRARRIGISLALIMRLALLSTIAWLVGLTAPVFDLGLQGAPDAHGEPAFETAFSWRDLILIAGGLFLVWKATKEIHHNVDPVAERRRLRHVARRRSASARRSSRSCCSTSSSRSIRS